MKIPLIMLHWTECEGLKDERKNKLQEIKKSLKFPLKGKHLAFSWQNLQELKLQRQNVSILVFDLKMREILNMRGNQGSQSSSRNSSEHKF